MATISVDKENGVIVYTDDDGTTRAVTIRREDCVISAIVENGYEEVELLRYNTSTSELEVIHNGTTLSLGAGGVGDMLKSIYDTGNTGVVDDAEDSQLLDGSTKAEVQDHTPKAHKASHQNGGTDEINVGGLSGTLADDQHILDAEAVSAMGAKADNNPLNHDRATEWGATEHTAIGDSSPHHVKYTDAEALAAALPLIIALGG